MQVSYKKLFDLLVLMGINQKELIEKAKISTTAMQKIRHSEFIALKTVAKICLYLDCTPNDILEIIPDKDKDYQKNIKENSAIKSQIAELQAKLKTLQEGKE